MAKFGSVFKMKLISGDYIIVIICFVLFQESTLVVELTGVIDKDFLTKDQQECRVLVSTDRLFLWMQLVNLTRHF